MTQGSCSVAVFAVWSRWELQPSANVPRNVCLETVCWGPCDHITLFSLIRTLVALRLVCRFRSIFWRCEVSSRQDGESWWQGCILHQSTGTPGNQVNIATVGNSSLVNPCSGHHIRSPDCHDVSPSVKAFSGLQGRALIARFAHRVVLRLFCVPRPPSPRLRWRGRLCVDTCRQKVVTDGVVLFQGTTDSTLVAPLKRDDTPQTRSSELDEVVGRCQVCGATRGLSL